MNDKNRESLSALLDGELVDQQALEELVSQSDCNQEFAALCEQRAALHGELNPHLPTDFSAKLAQAIAQEPTVLSPVAARGGTAPANAEYSSSNVVKGRFGFRMPNLAVAAGVAACSFAAMVLFTQSQTDSGEDFLVQNPISVESAAQSSFASVAPTLSVRQEAVHVTWKRLPPSALLIRI